MIADRAAQHGIARFERIEHGAGSGRPSHLEEHFFPDARQRLQMLRQLHTNHGNVWTSTESTGGRSRTIALQLSPPSADAYTCPPVVPK